MSEDSIKASLPSMADEKGLSKPRTHSDNGVGEIQDLSRLGYTPEMTKNRSMLTLLFQSLAIAAIPYGEGSPLMSAIYGGGQLSIFVGWIVVCILDECIALSLAELASRYPTSAGPYYWTFQLSSPKARTVLSFVNAWTWLIGNWTITLSVNFGFASLIAGAVGMYHPDYVMKDWELLLIFYALVIATVFICALGNKFLPMVDTICAAFTAISILIILIALSVKADAGRHSASYALSHYDKSFSGYGGFTFFIGLLPAAYCFSALGMISSMAEECDNPSVKVPRALALCVPVGGIAGLFFVVPICVLLPNLADIIDAPAGQALPFIFHKIMGSPGGGLGLTFLVLLITLFCSISITVAASRCTWAVARDHALPFAGTERAALLTFLLRFLQAATVDDAAADDEEVDEEEEDEEMDEEEEEVEDEEAEEVVADDELVLLELVLNAAEDDLEVVDEEEVVVGLTEVELVELVVGLTEVELVELVVGLLEVEVLLSEGVKLVGREEDCEDDERMVDEEDEEDTEEDDCVGAEDEDDRTEEVDDRDAELALDDPDVTAAKLALDELEEEEARMLLLLIIEELMLDEADVAAADDAEGELNTELDEDDDEDKLIDRGSATCEEVAAAGMDVLNVLEDERVTDEVVEDGFTNVEVEEAFDEVLLLLVFLLLDELEVEVGFCTIVLAYDQVRD
ncbi:amino acid transporter, partial [Aureobasidium melanogenum]